MECVNFEKNQAEIALLTDSCADLSAQQREGKPIFVLPPVHPLRTGGVR